MADRHGPLRTVMGRFVERANGGRISDGAVVVSAADFGLDDVALGVVEGAPTAPADLVSVVVPAGGQKLKIEIDMTIERMILLIPGQAVSDEPLVAAGGESTENDRVLDLHELLPAQSWTPTGDGNDGTPGSGWLTQRGRDTKIEISVEKVERAKAARVSTGTQQWAAAFGFEAADLPGRRTRAGETFDPERTMLAVTGRALVETWPGDGPPEALTTGLTLGDSVPDPAPLGGVSFGVGVLSTPLASVAGESANPVARQETAALLQRDVATGMLARAGITDSEDVQWVRGPDPVTVGAGPSTATLLGAETDVESFVGVVEGESGQWGVGVHVVRLDADDHVVAAGVHRRALGAAEANDATMTALRNGADLLEARRLFVETARRLETP